MRKFWCINEHLIIFLYVQFKNALIIEEICFFSFFVLCANNIFPFIPWIILIKNIFHLDEMNYREKYYTGYFSIISLINEIEQIFFDGNFLCNAYVL